MKIQSSRLLYSYTRWHKAPYTIHQVAQSIIQKAGSDVLDVFLPSLFKRNLSADMLEAPIKQARFQDARGADNSLLMSAANSESFV